MADQGFDQDRPEPGGEEEALLRFLAQFGITPGPDGRLDLEGLMGQLQPLMSNLTSQLASFGKSDASGMNWGFTKDVIRKMVASAGDDPVATPAQLAAIRDAVALADLWLDEEITFARLSAPAQAWRRADWTERTYPTWQRLVRPVVSQLSVALRGLMDAPDDSRAAAEPMLRMALSGMFAAQVGQSLGSLATTVVSSGDIGLPLTEAPQVALLPTNVAAFAEGLEAEAADILLFLAVRETARQRLFGAVGWLGPQLLALVEHYARDIAIDPDALERAIESQLSSAMTAGELEDAGTALAGSLFAPQVTEEQREVLERLETLLALVEGWVDEVVAQVAGRRMPAAAALIETLRRRRAAGGPAEAALKALVGLELRPRRTRDAANLWAATRATRGTEARDATWDHPDLVPTVADLADPMGFAAQGHQSGEPDDLDVELARLLKEEGRG